MAKPQRAKTNQIAVLVNHLGNPFEASLVTHVETLLAERGYSMLLHTYHQELSEQRLMAMAGAIDGLMLIGQTLPDTLLAEYGRLGIPVVSLLQPAWRMHGVPYVDMNWTKAMRIIVEYLQQKGHERIGFMTHGHPAHYHTQRFSAFIQAVKVCQGKFDHADVLHGGGTYLKAFDAMERRIVNGGITFTALVCANDLMAIGAMAACRHHFIRVPEQLAIIGCEDILMSSETNPPLTTIQYSRETLCRAAADKLFGLLNGGEETEVQEIESFLLVRSSG
jgi:DNA-binding LacI/PurR family transcriptional regulator